VPVILVFQSVCFSSKRQEVFPPFEIVVQGLFVPGILATRQPAGIGTWQCCEGSPFAMPKLQACSVVAGKSDGAWALASDSEARRLHDNMNQKVGNTRLGRIADAITVSSLAATGQDCVKSARP